MGAEFYFSCTRCGNCCSNGSGYVWIEPEEIAPMAAALSMTEDAFARRYVREAGGRLSLVEDRPGGGRCALLEGKNHCTVYGARPRHCREFPRWPAIVGGGEGFARARAICPGIHEVPPRAVRVAAYRELDALYARVDGEVAALTPKCEISGRCCDFPTAGHRLFATWLEVDSVVERGPQLGIAEGPGWCELYRGRRCMGREVRPLACRTYFCDPLTSTALAELHEARLAELRALERRLGYPQGYGDFVELVPQRRAAIASLDARRGRE
ncbi:MAG: YkgJ family cysteine cluster protein [Planctomycetes bacterium]|nr:YkgJ family cysteine cluster protein [Planctomycetota bacterium]